MKTAIISIVLLAGLSVLVVGCHKREDVSPKEVEGSKTEQLVIPDLGPPMAPSSLFPLKIGFKWVLSGKVSSGDELTDTKEWYEVVKVTTLDGITCFKVAVRCEGAYSRHIQPESVIYLAVTADGYYDIAHEWVYEGELHRQRKAPGFRFLIPDQKTAEWSSKWRTFDRRLEGDDGRGPYSRRNVTQTPAKVEVAGRLMDTVKVAAKQDLGEFVFVFTTWYALGFGPIKYKCYNEIDGKVITDIEAPTIPER